MVISELGMGNLVPDKDILGSALRYEIFALTPPAHLVDLTPLAAGAS